MIIDHIHMAVSSSTPLSTQIISVLVILMIRLQFSRCYISTYLVTGWKTDIESCKEEMDDISPLIKRRKRKCQRIES